MTGPMEKHVPRAEGARRPWPPVQMQSHGSLPVRGTNWSDASVLVTRTDPGLSQAPLGVAK